MWLKTNKTRALLGLDRDCSRRICTSIAVSVAVCRPGSVLAQAVGCDRGWAVVAQRWRPTGTAVHILHIHAAVTAGQVVLTHPAEHEHTALIYLFMSTSVQGMRTGKGTFKNLQSLNYQHCLNHTHTHTHSEMLRNCANICGGGGVPLKLVKCVLAGEAWSISLSPFLLSRIKTTPLSQGGWNRLNKLI